MKSRFRASSMNFLSNQNGVINYSNENIEWHRSFSLEDNPFEFISQMVSIDRFDCPQTILSIEQKYRHRKLQMNDRKTETTKQTIQKRTYATIKKS